MRSQINLSAYREEGSRLPDLQALLEISAASHSHLCPRQVLGVRMGLYGMALLELEAPVKEKRLLVIIETDGCFVDGIQAATGATPGHRTLRIEDYGKVAATFIDTQAGKAIRLAPRVDIRQRACSYAPREPRHYFAQLKGYQEMPDDQLFSLRPVQLKTPVEEILSRPGRRVVCTACGEEIMNDRQVIIKGQLFCRACSGDAYYQPEAPVSIRFAWEGRGSGSHPLFLSTLPACHE